MTSPTQEEIEGTIEALRESSEKIKGNPELARKVLESIEHRVLTTQPELTPKQRSEQLMGAADSGNNNNGAKGS